MDTFRDPYSAILSIMREQGKAYNPPSIILGEVISADPLTVKLEGIQIDKDNILIADYLLNIYERQYSVEGNIAFSSTDCGSTDTVDSHNHSISELSVNAEQTGNGAITFTDTLKAGDLLAVMPTLNMQTFVILARVVSMA